MRRAIGVASVLMSMLLIAPSAAAQGDVAGLGAAPVITTPDWYPQLLDAGNNRVNLGETILTPGNAGGLTDYWVQSASFAPYAAPVVDSGMVFEGGYGCCPSASNIRALSAKTGAVIWTYDTPTAVVATAAVSHGIVFAGDYNGVLYALNERTGKLLWSGKAGNQFFTPEHITIAGPVVYTATQTPGDATPATLAAWNASGCKSATCKPLWTASLAAASDGPAVDGKTVFVAEGNGWLYAFPANGCGHPSCRPRWKARTFHSSGHDPFTSLVISGGIVYTADGGGFGSRIDAFAATGCGASQCIPVWEYAAAGVPLAGLAVAQDTLYAGTAKGLEAFPAHCRPGSVCSTPIWSDPAAPGATLLEANGVVYASSGLTVLADNATTGARLWNASIPGSNPPANGPAVANGAVYVADTTGAEISAYHL